MTGVSIRELIKYPKNPKGLCIPSTAINKQNTTYMKRKIIEPMLYLDSPNVNERSTFSVQRRGRLAFVRCARFHERSLRVHVIENRYRPFLFLLQRLSANAER